MHALCGGLEAAATDNLGYCSILTYIHAFCGGLEAAATGNLGYMSLMQSLFLIR